MKVLLYGLLTAVVLALPACEGIDVTGTAKAVFEATKGYTAEGAAEVIDAHCVLLGTNIPARKEAMAAINAKSEKGDLTPFDCDQDGQPDFSMTEVVQ